MSDSPVRTVNSSVSNAEPRTAAAASARIAGSGSPAGRRSRLGVDRSADTVRASSTTAKGRPPVATWVIAGEALWLTLLAGLWFASLGHGGWALLFLLLGLATEWTARLHGGPRALAPGQRAILLAIGVTRTVIAGGLLTWILW